MTSKKTNKKKPKQKYNQSYFIRYVVKEFNLTQRQISEKAMATHSSTLAWKIPWMEEPGGLQSMGSLESDRTERLHFHFLLSCIGEGNGNPPQCSSLENPRDEGAWWAAVYGVTQSWTRLKWLSSSRSSSNDSNGLCFWLLRRTFNALFWHAW